MNPRLLHLVMLNCLYALQIMAGVIFVYSFFPQPLPEFAQHFFPMHQGGLQTERDIFFFRTFVVLAILLHAMGMVRLRFSPPMPLGRVIVVESVLTAGVMGAGLAALSFPHTVLTNTLLVIALGLALGAKPARGLVLRGTDKAIGFAGRRWGTLQAMTRSAVDGKGEGMALALVALLVATQTGMVLWGLKWPVLWAGVPGVVLFFILRRLFRQPHHLTGLITFIVVEIILTAMGLQAVFKIIVFAHRPQLAQYCFWVLMTLIVLHKIFFPEVDRILRRGWDWLVRGEMGAFRPYLEMGLPLFFVLLVFVPDHEAALARMFLGEQFHHTNAFMMCSGWAHIAGSILNVDVISRYGMGVVMFLSELANRLPGGYSYESMFLVVMWGVMLYYLLWHIFWRVWFNSLAWTVIGLLLAIKWQMFHTETFPMIYTYSNQTPIRCFWDICALGLLYQHTQTRQSYWLVLAGILCGWAIFYSTGDGLYLTLGFFGYLAAQLLTPELRSAILLKRWGWRALCLYGVIPFVSAFAWFALGVGRHVVSPVFWQNMGEFMKYYKSGFGSTPMISSWTAGNSLEFLIGAALPVFYIATVLAVASLVYYRILPSRHTLIIFVGVYALGAYHYYAMLSNNTSYYRNGVLISFLLCFWGWLWLKNWPAQKRRAIQAALMALCLYALVTHHNFVSFPNIFNVSRNPNIDPLVAEVPMGRRSYFNHLFISYPDRFKLPRNSLGEVNEMLVTEADFKDQAQLKEFYRREFDFTRDAALIQKLIPPKDKVPLISSFETKILIQAKRRPFFYFFEMVNSRPRRMRIFVVTHLYTIDNLQRTIDQLEREKPPYIFLERIFLTKEIPQAYLYDSMDLMMLLNYVFAHYELSQEGEFLAALKRK